MKLTSSYYVFMACLNPYERCDYLGGFLMSGDFVLILKKRDMIIPAFKSGSFGVPV